MHHPTNAESLPTFGHEPSSPATLGMAIALVVLGMDVFIIQPGFVQGLVDVAGYDPAHAGVIASSEMFGIAAATVLMMWCAARVNWLWLCRIALISSLLANLFSLTAASAGQFASWRFLAGLASGTLISLGYAVASMLHNPDRSFGWIIVWVLVYGAIGIFILPPALSAVGLNGILIFFAAAAGAGLFCCSSMPTAPVRPQSIDRLELHVPLSTRTLLLGAVLCYFLGQGCLWAYLSLIGIADGGSEQQVAAALTVAQFLGIAGAFAAATLGSRITHRTSMIAGILIGTAPLLLFVKPAGALVYALAVGVFNLAANFMTPMLTAVVARQDPSGRLVVHAVAMQMLGLAAGPALAAPFIRPNDYTSIIFLSIALFLLCLVLILPPVLSRAKHARLETQPSER